MWFFVCLLVVFFLSEIRQIEGYLQFWMKYLFESFWDFSGIWFTTYVSHLCLSAGLLAYFLYWNKANIGISPVLDKISFWYIFGTFLGFGSLLWNNFEFPVCPSVWYLAHFFTGSRLIWGFLQFYITYFYNFFGCFGCLYTSSKQYWISYISVGLLIFLLPYWN